MYAENIITFYLDRKTCSCLHASHKYKCLAFLFLKIDQIIVIKNINRIKPIDSVFCK